MTGGVADTESAEIRLLMSELTPSEVGPHQEMYQIINNCKFGALEMNTLRKNQPVDPSRTVSSVKFKWEFPGFTQSLSYSAIWERLGD